MKSPKTVRSVAVVTPWPGLIVAARVSRRGTWWSVVAWGRAAPVLGGSRGGVDVSSGEWLTAREASRVCDAAMIVFGLALPAAQLVK
ncbi:hypothetical protein [Nonomuraea recticatena]|uniref:hypothetical protein n=1 Tax=Nonomuraea recticatena TaxID=46178 RepID=UPI003622B9B2